MVEMWVKMVNLTLIAQGKLSWYLLFRPTQLNWPIPSSLIALTFQSVVEHCNADVKIDLLLCDDLSASGRNLVSF